MKICVVGGGLAGLSAAITAADGGAEVTLLEARGRLGGATFSFERDGLSFDNGQHVFLRCCTAYREFLDRLGVAHLVRLQPRLSIPVISPGGRVAKIERDAAKPPLHLARALASYPHLSARDKVTAIRVLRALKRIDLDDPATDRIAFGTWLRQHGQSDAAIDALWGLIGIATLNLRADDASLSLAGMVFRTGLLEDAGAADIGVSTVPLSDLHARPAAAALDSAGADVQTGVRVIGLGSDADGPWVRTRDETHRADAVVVAVPHDAAAELLPDAADLHHLGTSPIVNLHVHYDRRVLDTPFATGHPGPVQWVFDHTAQSGAESGQVVTVSLSAAEEHLGQPVAALRERFLPAMAELFPAAREATVQRFVVSREPHATFRGTPGSRVLRRSEETALPGVLLAGSWTDTGWPATMEGAVRSGMRAARRALLFNMPREGVRQ